MTPAGRRSFYLPGAQGKHVGQAVDIQSLRFRLLHLRERVQFSAALAYRSPLDLAKYGWPRLETFGDLEPGRVEGFNPEDPIAWLLAGLWVKAHGLVASTEESPHAEAAEVFLASAEACVRQIESALEIGYAAAKTERSKRARSGGKAKAAPWIAAKAYAEEQHSKLATRLSTRSSALHIAIRARTAGLTPPGKTDDQVQDVLYKHLLAVQADPSKSVRLLAAEEIQR